MQTPFRLGAILLMVLVCLPIQSGAQVIEKEFQALEEGNFFIRGRDNLQNGFWVVEQFVNKRIGYAPYDEVRRRYNLFDLKSRYWGFLQATMDDFIPDQLYKQYLFYGPNSRYKGVFIRQLGGRSLPYEPEMPPHLRRFGTGPPAGSYGKELGGQWYPYAAGNVSLTPPEETQIGIFRGLVGEELERKD
jgi:hypothetical protein